MSQHSVPWSKAQLESLLRVYSDDLAGDPDDLELRLKLGEVLRLLGKIEQAVALYGSVAWAYAVAGNLAQAIVLCKVILTLRPQHSQTQRILARLYASKRIRDAKKAVNVEQVEGRWVADPGKRLPFAETSLESISQIEGSPLKTLDAQVFAADAGETIPPPPAQPKRRTRTLLTPEPALVTQAPGASVAGPLEPTLVEDVDALAPTEIDDGVRPVHSAGDAVEADLIGDDVSVPTAVEVPKPRSARRSTKPLQMIATETTQPEVQPIRRGRALEEELVASPSAVEEPPPPLPDQPLDTAQEADLFRSQELMPPENLPRPTAPMPAVDLSTMLRKDAEFAYREGRSTLGYAAIRRKVADQACAQEQLDTEPMDDDALQQRLDGLVSEQEPNESEQDTLSLPQIPLFSHLDREAFISLVERLEARVYGAGELVIAEGESGDTLLLVASGSLSVFKDDDGREVELARLETGAFFGEFALLTDQRRHASVRCRTECEILVMRRAMLADLIRDYPAVQQTLSSFYQRRVLQMVLATSSLFQAVPAGEREALVEEFATQRLADGEVVVAEGEEGHAFYVILVGEVAVSCRDQSGEDEIEVGRLKEGDYFGEMSLISGYAAEATVRATRMTEVLKLEGKTFYEMASTHPEIWAEVQRESELRAEANDRIIAERRARALLL